MGVSIPSPDWSAGAAYVDGQAMPLKNANSPIADWGYRRSDATYDVAGVYYGAFVRLEHHLRRFRASMESVKLKPRETGGDIPRPRGGEFTARTLEGIASDLAGRVGSGRRSLLFHHGRSRHAGLISATTAPVRSRRVRARPSGRSVALAAPSITMPEPE
jgi:hypothetical protein